MALNSIEEIIDDIGEGKMVILMDDEDRENEGDLIMAASLVRPRGHQFHGPLRPRPDLPHPDPRALSRSSSCR